MAELSGYGGGFSWDSTAIWQDANNIHAWSLDINCDGLDKTDMTDSGNRTFIRGLKGWTATVEGFVDATSDINLTLIGTAATINLTVDSSNTLYYTGSAFLTGYSPAVPVDGAETYSLTFQGSGALTYETS